MKSLHSGGERHWQTLLRQTAKMWLGYEGRNQAEVEEMQTPTLVLAGDRDTLLANLIRHFAHRQLRTRS